MDHHVLHVAREHRVPVLVDLTSAPGRTMVFTRTKHGAKALARQLNRSGVPAVELHGNLSQGARTRNMDAFHSGRATTLVATDIAARGIHVDDVALVVHADPPAEHKAYLHRSGRTARAGAAGTVITLMTEEQVRDVRDLTRAAGIKPTITRVDGPRHAILTTLAPGRAGPRGRRPRRADRRHALAGRGGSGPSGRAGAGPHRPAGRSGQHRRSRPRPWPRPGDAARAAVLDSTPRDARSGPGSSERSGTSSPRPARHPAGAAATSGRHGRVRRDRRRRARAVPADRARAAAGSTPPPSAWPRVWAVGAFASGRCTSAGSRPGTGTPARW